MTRPVLRVDGVSHVFRDRSTGWFGQRGRRRVLSDISLDVREGETLALIGESGSGKSTLARIMLGLVSPSLGQVRYRDQPLVTLKRRDLRRKLQVVLQDTQGALDPRLPVGKQIAEPLIIHGVADTATRCAMVRKAMDDVRLDARLGRRLPHQLSGGQRQRAVIARALVLQPETLVCDEATSALDVTTQAEIVGLLRRLQQRHGLTLVLITHDLQLASSIADRIAVLSAGRLVEIGQAGQIIDRPRACYTRALADAAFGSAGDADAGAS